MPFTIKAICNKTLKIKRFYVDPAITYDALVQAIATGFGCTSENPKLCISYIDCESDFVSIGNTDDLRVAIDLFNEKQLLKLFINPCCPPPEPAGQCGAGQCGAGKCGAGQCGAGKCGKGPCGKPVCPVEQAIQCRKKTACNYFRAKFPSIPCGGKPAGPCGAGPGAGPCAAGPCAAGPCGAPAGPCGKGPCGGGPCGGFGGPFGGFGGPCGRKKFCLKKWFARLHGLSRAGGFGGFGKCHGGRRGGGPGGPCFGGFGGPGKCGGFGGPGKCHGKSKCAKGPCGSGSNSSAGGPQVCPFANRRFGGRHHGFGRRGVWGGSSGGSDSGSGSSSSSSGSSSSSYGGSSSESSN